MDATDIKIFSMAWSNADHTCVDMIIELPNRLGIQLPFTANPNDCEEYGRKLYQMAVNGELGNIAEYVPPPPDETTQPPTE